MARKLTYEELEKRVKELEKEASKRKQAEEKLKESEERFRQFFENEPEYCYMISPEGVIINVNNAALKALGYMKEELVGKPLKTIYAPEVLPKTKELFLKWGKTGKLKDEELVIITKKGDRRTVLLSADVVKDRDGKIMHSVSVQKDITEIKLAEKALRESEEKHKLLFENSGSAISYYDPEGKMVLLNRQGAKNLGGEAEDFIGKSVYELFPEVADFHMQRFSKIMKEGKGAQFEDVFELPGRKYWFLSDLQPVKDESGNIKGVQIISDDITDDKKAEEALRESEEKYRSLVESTEDSIYLVDRNCRYLFVNKKHLSRFTLPIGKVIGRAYSDFHSEEETKGFEEKIKEVFETGKSLPYEYRSQRDGGYFLRTLSPVKEPDGETIAVTVVSKNISERKQAEEALKQERDNLQDALAEVKTLSGLLPICANCKKIRDDKGYWNQIEVYIRDHSEADFSHSICPECAKKLYPEFYKGD